MLIKPMNKRKIFGLDNNVSVVIDNNNLLILLSSLHSNTIKKFYLFNKNIYYENINDLNFFLNYKVL